MVSIRNHFLSTIRASRTPLGKRTQPCVFRCCELWHTAEELGDGYCIHAKYLDTLPSSSVLRTVTGYRQAEAVGPQQRGTAMIHGQVRGFGQYVVYRVSNGGEEKHKHWVSSGMQAAPQEGISLSDLICPNSFIFQTTLIDGVLPSHAAPSFVVFAASAMGTFIGTRL